MPKFLELEVRTYMGKEYREYEKKMDELEDPENEDWKKEQIENDIIAPISKPSKVLIFDPKIMELGIENSSIEAVEENREDPKFDTVDLYLSNGLVLSIIGTINSLKKKVEKFYAE